ncbi:arylsulfotransferase family protein [Salinibacter sp.]|uniref:arylsulfotransferase family protein n=1 Tax=Salinibacter sp. TaxID=2065818 RepID=UPI0021E7E336|nr:arylsulfotransferase family protein [Salinibacter sp.]
MRSSVAKGAFVASLMVFSFLYGFGAREKGWFPNALIEQVWRQAKVVSPLHPPNFVNPRVYDRTGADPVAPEEMKPGLTLVTSMWDGPDGWGPEVRLMDRAGRPVHTWRLDPRSLFPDSLDQRRIGRRYIHGSHLEPDGTLLVNFGQVGTVQVDACGDVQWRLAARSHHSIERAEDGTYWIPGSSKTARRTTAAHPEGFPGLDKPVYHEPILHVSADGEVQDRLNVLDLLYANDLERYIAEAFQPQAKGKGPQTKDITHMNDVEPLGSSLAGEHPLFDAGDLLVSLRNLDLVFVVDPGTRTIKWHADDPFLMQHDPDFLGDGWIGVFDNASDFTFRGTMLGGSRIVALQPHTDSVEVRFPTPQSDSFYTAAQGKWQQLDNGNMLLTESRAGRVVEVTPEGRTVWEWIIEPYSDRYVPAVTQATRYALSRTDVAAWPCSSVEATPAAR